MTDVSNHVSEVKGLNRPWLICFAASLLFFYEFIQGNMFASIADDMMRDFHIQANEMMILSSIYYAANVIFLAVAGVLLDRISAKKILIIAMFFCVLSTLMLGQTHDFWVAFVCRFVIGVGSAFCFLGPVRIATRWFLPRQMALVTGAIVTVAMSGGLLAQYPLTLLVRAIGWREAMFQVSLLGVLMLVFMALFIQDGPQVLLPKRHSQVDFWQRTRRAYLNRETFFAGLYASLMNMGVAILGAVMGQLYLVQRLGVEQSTAAMVNGMLFLGAMVGGPLIGWCSDRLGSRLLPMKAGAFVSLLVALAILYAPVSVGGMAFLFFILGLSTSSQVISYAMVAEKSSPVMVASSISLVSMLLQGGYIVYQNAFATVLSLSGSVQVIHGVPVYSLWAYQVAVLILPISFVVAWMMLFGLTETHCRQQQGDAV